MPRQIGRRSFYSENLAIAVVSYDSLKDLWCIEDNVVRCIAAL